jgi:hypothetical protein
MRRLSNGVDYGADDDHNGGGNDDDDDCNAHQYHLVAFVAVKFLP